MKPYERLSNDEIIDVLLAKPPRPAANARSAPAGDRPGSLASRCLDQQDGAVAVPHHEQKRFGGRRVEMRSNARRRGPAASQAPLGHVSSEVVMRCCDNIAFMRSFPDSGMHLIVTSPPYNIGKEYESRSPLDAYVQAQIPVIDECVRLLHLNGSLCWQVGNHVEKGEILPLDILLYPLFRERGLKLRNRIIWHFEHGLHCSKRLSGRYETILWFTKGSDYTFNLDPIRVPSKYPGKRYFKGPRTGKLSGNPLGKNPSDVWIFPNVKNNHVEKTIHPCQFPVELVERLVLALTDPRQKVFDPYMGVGTSVVAAVKHGRAGYGCDNVPEYVDIARQRVKHLQAGLLKTRPMDRPVYDPAKPYGGQKDVSKALPLFVDVEQS